MALQRVPNLSIHSLTQSLNQVLLVSCRTCCILAWVFSQTRRQVVVSANAIVSACVTLHMQRKRTICWLDATRVVKGEWYKSLAWHLNGIRVTEVMAWILFIILSICEPWKGSRRESVCLSVCQAASQSCSSCHDSFWLLQLFIPLPIEWSTAHQFERQLPSSNPKILNNLFHWQWIWWMG